MYKRRDWLFTHGQDGGGSDSSSDDDSSASEQEASGSEGGQAWRVLQPPAPDMQLLQAPLLCAPACMRSPARPLPLAELSSSDSEEGGSAGGEEGAPVGKRRQAPPVTAASDWWQCSCVRR